MWAAQDDPSFTVLLMLVNVKRLHFTVLSENVVKQSVDLFVIALPCFLIQELARKLKAHSFLLWL